VFGAEIAWARGPSGASYFEDAVRLAVRCGGDTDTIGARAIAGAPDGAASIPKRWLEALEEGEKVGSHIERLAC
jgi:ADP-ribosylglycohydrolase